MSFPNTFDRAENVSEWFAVYRPVVVVFLSLRRNHLKMKWCFSFFIHLHLLSSVILADEIDLFLYPRWGFNYEIAV